MTVRACLRRVRLRPFTVANRQSEKWSLRDGTQQVEEKNHKGSIGELEVIHAEAQSAETEG